MRSSDHPLPEPDRAVRTALALAVVAALLASPAFADPWYQHYDLAEKALAAEDWTAAVEQLTAAIERKGDSGARVRTYGMKFTDYFPYLKLGIAYYHLGQLDAALQAFDTEERLGAVDDVDRARTQLLDYRLRIDEARREAAAEEERRIRQIVTASLGEAAKLEGRGELDAALEALGRALAVAPDDRQAQEVLRRLREKVSRRQAERQRAERIAQQVADGERLLAQGKYDEASRYFRQALSEAPDPRVQKLLDQAQAALRARLEDQEESARRELVANALAEARRLEATGDLARALDRLESVTVLDPANPKALELRNRLLEARARQQTESAQQAEIARLLATADAEIRAGNPEKALATANKVLAVDPGNATALEAVSQAYRAVNRQLLGSAARENIPPAISFADFRQEVTDEGDPFELVASPNFRLSGVVIDDAPVQLVIRAGGELIANPDQPPHSVGNLVLTEFKFKHRLAPGPVVFRLVARDAEGLLTTGEYAVVYVRPWYRFPALYGALGTVAAAGLALVFGYRTRQRRKLRERRFNPYVAGAPILDDDLFFGRQRLLDRILQTIHNNSLLLYGERRIGKTSIQHHLLKRLTELEDPRFEFYPVYIDLQGTPQERFFSTLADEIFHELAPVSGGLEPSPVAGYDYRELVRDLRRLFAVLKEKSAKQVKLVLLIDEVDELNDYDPKVNQRLRSLFMKSFAENLVAVVSGVSIKKQWTREASPWYNFFEEIEVKPFRARDARELIERPIRGLFKLEAGVTDRIVELTDAKPYLIQKMCMALVYRLYERGRRKITLADVEAIGPPPDSRPKPGDEATPPSGAPAPAGGRPAASPAAPPARHRVGRAAERQALAEGLASVESGRGLVICVAGEPGIGKTTLVEDFVADLGRRNGRCTVVRGRCSERLTGGEGYLPFLEALDSLVRGPDGQLAGRLMQHLAPTWHAEIAPVAADQSEPSQLAGSQERIKRELAAFFGELARRRPLLLFLDDLHWADASTVDLLAFLAGKLDTLRLLIVVAYRSSELKQSRHPFLELKLELRGRDLCREVSLSFLTRQDIERYLDLEFSGHRFPDAFAALIHARTEGNPLFMVDLLRYLQNRGEIRDAQGSWALGRPLSELEAELPPSTRSMIESKIGQLDDADRRLLAAASVQGHDFDSAVLAQALELDPAAVEERLETLDRVHEIVRRRDERELPDGTPTVRCRFVHVLYQDALFAALQPTRRAQLAKAVAEALLGSYGERSTEVAAELAFLFETAREAARAAHHFRLAAQSNARLFACHEAAVLARRGLQLLAALPATDERRQLELVLVLVLGPALMMVQGFASREVEETYARARELCRQVGETARLFPALWGLWQYYVMRPELPAALELAQQLFGLAGNPEDADLLPEAYRALGETSHWMGEPAAAQPHLEQGVALYDRARHGSHAQLYGLDPGVGNLGILCWVLWTRGCADQAVAKSREALELARAQSHPFGEAFALFVAAGLHMLRREAEEGLAYAEETIKLSAEQGFPFWWATGTVTRGWAWAELGRVEEAQAEIRQAVAAYQATGAGIALPWMLCELADVLRRGGRGEEALPYLAQARAHVDKTGDRWWEAELERIHGEVLLALGHQDRAGDAEARFRRALAIARRQGARAWELRAATSLSRLLHGQGNGQQARRRLKELYESFSEGLETPDLKDARSLLEELSGQ